MDSVVSYRSGALAILDRVEFILVAVDYLLQDDLDLHAMILLGEAEKLISQLPVGAEQHTRFRRLLARCLSARADLNTLYRVIDANLSNATPDERARLEAERAEFHMLSGDLTLAERDVAEEGHT
jgi:hypothetical protein